jgi:ubiquinone biosynthesis protein
MRLISRWIRLWQIQRALLRHGLLEIFIKPDSLFRPLATLSTINPWYWQSDKSLSRGARLRLTLQELGPFFIKFGQLLSTRRDILPDDIADELSKLQDQVAPFTQPDPALVISQALGQPLTEVVIDFCAQPLASASIAQVHSAKLPNGKKIVLKVLRPDIEKIIDNDVYWLKVVAKRASRYVKQGARLMAIVKEIEQTIYAELDLLREAANASQLQRYLSNVDYVHIPEIIWPLSRKNLLVMEHMHGIPLTDMPRVRVSGVDLKKLAEEVINLFFLQVFEHGFFHADFHGGNLFLNADNPAAFKIIMVDFGIVGVLNNVDLAYLGENLNAFLNHDYRKIAELHIESGWVPADTRPEQLASAISTVCEPLLAQPLREISFGQVLLRLLQTASDFNMEVQPQLILLQKTLINVEGLSRQLYPDVDFFQTAKYTIERWMRKRSGLRGLLHEFHQRAPRLASQLPALPELVYQFLNQAVKPAANKNISTCITKPIYRRGFWTGLGTASLITGVALSAWLSYLTAMELTEIPLLLSAGLGLLGIGSLWYGCSKN